MIEGHFYLQAQVLRSHLTYPVYVFGDGILVLEPWRCDAIYYAAICRALLERFGAYFSDEVMKPAVVSWPKVNLPKLRPEQTEALVMSVSENWTA